MMCIKSVEKFCALKIVNLKYRCNKGKMAIDMKRQQAEILGIV